MSHIEAFFRTTAVVIVCCGILQQRYIKPPQYICFSSVNLNIAVLQNPIAINILFCADTIAVVYKIVAICKLQRCRDDCHNRFLFLRRFFLDIAALFPTPKFSFVLFCLPSYQVFTFPTYSLSLSPNSYSLQNPYFISISAGVTSSPLLPPLLHLRTCHQSFQFELTHSPISLIFGKFHSLHFNFPSLDRSVCLFVFFFFLIF